MVKRPDSDAYGTFLTDFAGGLGYVGLAIYEAYPHLSGASIRLLGQQVEVSSNLLVGLGGLALAISYPVGAVITAFSSLSLSWLRPLALFRCPAKWVARFKEDDHNRMLLRTRTLLEAPPGVSLDHVDDVESLLDPLVSSLSPATYAEMARLRGISQLLRNLALLAVLAGVVEGIKNGLGGSLWSLVAVPGTLGVAYVLLVFYAALQLLYRVWIARQAWALLIVRRLTGPRQQPDASGK